MDPRDFNIPFFGIDNSNNYITSSCRSKQKYGYSFDIKQIINNYSNYYFGELHNIFNKEEINRVFQSFKKEKWIGYINFKLLIKITELLKNIKEKGIVNTKETLRDIE